MTARSPRHDARLVVAGGGLAGLLTACAAAREGCRTLLLEAAAEPGGRARGTEHHGHHLTLGPRALYRGGPLWRMLADTGALPRGGVPSLAGSRALIGGELLPGFADVRGMLTSPVLSPRGRLAVGRLMGLCRAKPSLAGRSGARWLAETLPDRRAADAAFALTRVMSYAGDPERISADALAGRVAAARRGVLYADGGWQAIVDGLLRRARDLGVTVRTEARVEEVAPGDGGPVVRLAGGEEIRCGAAVLAGLPPDAAARILGTPLSAAPAGPPLYTACLDVALDRLPVPRNGFVYGVDEPVYLGVFSTAARLAPPGGAVLHLARFDDGTAITPQDARKRLEDLLDLSQPGWRDHVVRERFLPRMRTMTALPTPGTGGLAGRPGTRVPGRPGIFLAGDWVGPEGILADATGASARAAVTAGLAHLDHHGTGPDRTSRSPDAVGRPALG